MERAVIVKWIIKPAEVERILALLPELAEKTRAEKGNLHYAVYQSDADPSELFLVEKYVDADAADAHRQSEHYQRLVATGILPHLAVREVTCVKALQ
ncbi:putative quinol monooxygenase [Anatilimnocola sp. NA78]|uniref:putative quinol monooxygenase n=1 Tax=Anatilimnocola sp. NA78 TaxID=3415683 RepID=UPI003CE4E566